VSPSPFLPCSLDEARARSWDRLDVILVSGDAAVDHPSFPAALLGRLLEAAGYRVGLIPQPRSVADVARLGLPRLFFGVTAGALDSMVANYTASKRRRSDDAYSPGGVAGARPDRAVTVYCGLLRQAFGKEAFLVAGGLEASLRRFAHYDFWSDSVRRPLLMDGGADVLVHGMGEGPALALAERLAALDERAEVAPLSGEARRALRVEAVADLPGIVYRRPAREPAPPDSLGLPSAEEVAAEPRAQAEAHRLFERERDRCLWQIAGGMRVIANPAWPPASPAELDRLHALPFTRAVHPVHQGARVPALEQVRFSVSSHRGCFGGCAFCAIGAHQGKAISSRSPESVLAELRAIAAHPEFRGTVQDLGGPSANMYGMRCGREQPCRRPSCLWPQRCPDLVADARPYLDLLEQAAQTPGVRHLFVTTGLRMDLALLSQPLIEALAFRHTSGQLKVAPEHVCPAVLARMRKPAGDDFDRFLRLHRRLSQRAGRSQFVLPYLMAAHPGSRLEHMVELALYLRERGIVAEQCQIFTPTPGTAAAVMYATGIDPLSMESVFVERDPEGKALQKALILYHLPEQRERVLRALRLVGRPELAGRLLGAAAGARGSSPRRPGPPPRGSAGPAAGPRRSGGRRRGPPR